MFGRLERMVRAGYWAGTAASETTSSITVAAGNNSQALAVGLSSDINLIGTSSATASTGVRLPVPLGAGTQIAVFNGGANSTLVYPQVGGTIDALSQNAGFTLAAGKKAVFLAVSATNWVAILSA